MIFNLDVEPQLQEALSHHAATADHQHRRRKHTSQHLEVFSSHCSLYDLFLIGHRGYLLWQFKQINHHNTQQISAFVFFFCPARLLCVCVSHHQSQQAAFSLFSSRPLIELSSRL